MRQRKVFLSCFCSGWLLLSSLFGQSQRWRQVATRDIEGDQFSGYLVPKSDSKISVIVSGAGLHDSTLNLGFTKLLAGATVCPSFLPSGDHLGPFDRFLFAGEFAGGKGGLVLIGPSNGTYRILAQKTYPGRSFTGVGYSIPHKKLYLLDQTNHVILRGDFDPAQSVLPASLTVAVNASQCSGLNNASDSTLYVGNETGAHPGIVLGKYPSPMDFTFWTIWDNPTGPVCSEHLGDLDFPRLDADRGLLLDGQVQVKVSGKPGEAFQVVSSLTGTVFGSGQIGAMGEALVGVSPLMMGDFYGVKSMTDGKVHDPYLTPVKMWSSPDRLASGFQMQSLLPTRGLVAEIGADLDMAPSLSMDRPANPPSTSQQWQAWLLVGTEQDVQPVGGGKYVIVSNLAVPGQVYWNRFWKQGVGSIAFQTPTDLNLAGTVVTFQWMVQEGSQLYFSDILGTMLRGYVWDPGQVHGPSAQGGGSSASKSAGGKSVGGTPKKLRRPQARRKMDATVRSSLGRWFIGNGAKALSSKIWRQLKSLSRKR